MSDQRISLQAVLNRGARVRRQIMSNQEANEYVAWVLALVEAVEAARDEETTRRIMERTPTKRPREYATRRQHWEMARDRKQRALARFNFSESDAP